MITKNSANADLRIKSGKPRGTSSGGSPKMMGVGSALQMKDKPRDTNGGNPKMMETADATLAKDKPRPPVGGGSPKIAAVLNFYGNDYIRQASQLPDEKADQKPGLIKTAQLCYQQAFDHDPNDPGLLVNLAMANLLIGDITGAEAGFVDAFNKSQKDFNKLFALLSLKYDHNKFADDTQLSVVEKILRTTIKKCVEKAGTPTPQPPNQSILGEGSPSGPQGITTVEATEFLYIKTIDSEEA